MKRKTFFASQKSEKDIPCSRCFTKKGLKMTEMDLVVLTSTRNEYLFEIQRKMINSFVKNSPESCRMIILENNSVGVYKEKWKKYVLGQRGVYRYIDKPFNMNYFYNIGTAMSKTKLICYCNSDLIFHKGWYENLVKWFDIYSDLVCACPYTACESVWQQEASADDVLYRYGRRPKNMFVFTYNLAGWFYCLKRKFVKEVMGGWDENFVAHFQDNDLSEYLKRGQFQTGVSLDSRVDHLVGTTFKCLEIGGNEQKRFVSGETYFKEKWGGNHT